MYKQDLELNNQQGLICLKILPTNQSVLFVHFIRIFDLETFFTNASKLVVMRLTRRGENIYIYIYTHTYTYTHIHTHTHTYISTHTHLSTHTHTHIYIYIHIHVCVRVCVCKHTHTHKYIVWNDKIVVLKKTTLQLYFKTFIEKINSGNLIM